MHHQINSSARTNLLIAVLLVWITCLVAVIIMTTDEQPTENKLGSTITFVVAIVRLGREVRELYK
jgi:hypothetical protein